MILSLFRKTPAPTLEEQLAEAKALAERGEYDAALAIWGPLAHKGVARAANNVGACFAGGLGVERNDALAFTWLKLAADGGDPAGMRNLAAAYFQGQGTPVDPVEALVWYRKAADLGDAQAQDMASWMLVEGELVAADYGAARTYAEQAANAGIPAAMTRMGMIFHNALGIERDPEAACNWWAKAVEKGDADSAAMLGAANHLGQGVERDLMRAMVLLIIAKEGGSPLAETFYGVVRAGLPDEAFAEAQALAADIRAGGSAPS